MRKVVYTRRKKLRPNSEETPVNFDNLPLDILREIVLLLPFKYSALTSILSKQWKHLWLSNTNYKLTPSTVQLSGRSSKVFQKIVNDVIYHHAGPGIKKITVAHPNPNNGLSLPSMKWMDHLAKNHPITDLVFDIRESSPPPQSLFSCKYLVNLQITLYGSFITIPDKVQLPNLKRMCIKDVIFINSGDFKRFLNGCRGLEIIEFEALYCNWTDELNLKIDLPELKVFRFNSQYDFVYVYLSARKLEILEFWGKHLIVEVFFSEIKEVRRIEFQQWVRPYLNKKRNNNLWQFGEKMNNTLHALSKTRTLSLGEWCTEHLTTIADTLELPIFWNLKQLHVSFWPNKHHEYIILYLVRCSPFLESLKLETCQSPCDEIYSNEQREDYPEPPIIYEDIFGDLKHIEMRLFQGTNEELKLVETLLSACPVLERFDIKFAQRVKQHVRHKVKAKVPGFPRFSNSVHLTIANYTPGWE